MKNELITSKMYKSTKDINSRYPPRKSSKDFFNSIKIEHTEFNIGNTMKNISLSFNRGYHHNIDNLNINLFKGLSKTDVFIYNNPLSHYANFLNY